MYEQKNGVLLLTSQIVKRDRGERERQKVRLGIVWKYTYVLIFISPSSQPLIINVVDLMVYKGGPRVNHLFDGSP